MHLNSSYVRSIGRLDGRFRRAAQAIVQVKPDLSVVLTGHPWNSTASWALALAGQLKYAHLQFTKPHYNSDLVVNASFSNELEE